MPGRDEKNGRPLPRGRHELSREEVERSQRERLRRATIEVVADVGFQSATVGAIATLARVSRETFYRLYTNKSDAYWDAYSGVADALHSAAQDELSAPDEPPMVLLRRSLDGYLAWLAADPVMARCLVLERPGRPGEMTKLELAVGARGDAAVAQLFPDSTAFDRASYAAALDHHVRGYVAAGRTAQLPELAPSAVTIAERLLVSAQTAVDDAGAGVVPQVSDARQQRP